VTACRIACLWVPLFPLAARLRSEPELIREALAVLEGNGNAARVVAATRLARQAGIRPGQTLAQARVRLPKLVARRRDIECERTAQEALLEAAERFSPRVEDPGEGVAFLDADGLELHFPGEFPERDLGHALYSAAEAAGLPVRVGIAGSKLAARVAATLPDSPTVVPPGEEANFLSPLPLDQLAPAVRATTTLERWGIRTIGDLARLPAAQVTSRLGEIGRTLHATARGLDPRPLMPRQPPPTFREGMTLEWPLVALEPFLFVARAALERLCARMAARGLSCRRLEISLSLEPDGFHERAIDLPGPSREIKTLLTLIRLELEARPPGAPVTAFTLTAQPDRPREAQLSLFGPAQLSPDRLAATLAQLFAMLGPGRSGSPRPVDGHRPEGFALVDYQPPPPPKVRRAPPRGRGLLTVRVLRPPVAVEVLTAGKKLLSLQGTPTADGEKRPKIQGRVRVAAGPWALEEQWWSEGKTERDYWDIELSDGGLYRLYRDRASKDWFVDGIYD